MPRMTPEMVKKMWDSLKLTNDYQSMMTLLRQASENMKEGKDIALSLSVVDGIVNHHGLADYMATTRRGVIAHVQQGELGDIAGSLIPDLKDSITKIKPDELKTLTASDEKVQNVIKGIGNIVDTPVEAAEAGVKNTAPTPFSTTLKPPNTSG